MLDLQIRLNLYDTVQRYMTFSSFDRYLICQKIMMKHFLQGYHLSFRACLCLQTRYSLLLNTSAKVCKYHVYKLFF